MAIERHDRAYAKPNTIPSIKKEKYTLCAEWTMMPIQVLRKRQLGNAYPGLVGVVGAMEHTVCYPAPLAKYSLHFRKQHSPK
jgi:hypothetical protein